MLTCPVTKKNNFIVPVTKKQQPFLPPFCTPLAQGANILTRAIWVPPTYACKILSGYIKVCWSYLWKADFEQLHIIMPNSITPAGSKLVADRFEDDQRPALNLSATSFEPASNQIA